MSNNKFCLEHPAGDGVPVDWVDVTIPADVYRELGDEGAGQLVFRTEAGVQSPVVEQFARGRQGVNVRVMGIFAQSTVTGSFVRDPQGIKPLPFMRHPSVPERIVPRIGTLGYVFFRDEVIRSNDAEELRRMCLSDGDGVVVIWTRVRSMHPVVDVGVRWSRRSSDGYVPNVTFNGQFESHPVAGFASGLPGFADPLCAPTQWYRVTFEPANSESALEQVLRNSVTALWPIGACMKYARVEEDGARWLTLGAIPTASIDYIDNVQAKIDYMLANGDFYAFRPTAQALSANQAGTQRFGVAEGGLLDFLDLSASWSAMRLIAGDEELRPIHYYNEDGSRLDLDAHREFRTHNRRIDWRNSRDKLWFDRELPRVSLHSNRTTDDEQHCDDLGIDAFLALWDDPALEETRRMMVDLDFADTQMLSGRTNSAARGIGRPMLSLATAAWLFGDDETGRKASTSCLVLARNVLGTWEGKDVAADRPIKPIATIKGNASWNLRDPRTGEPMRAAAPYEHATVVAGLLSAAQVLPEMHRPELYGLATMLTDTVMSWAHQDRAGLWQWPFIVACLDGEEDGLALPAEWTVEGADEFAMTRVAGGSWTTWTAITAFAVFHIQQMFPAARNVLRRHEAAALQITERIATEGHDGPSYLEARFTAIADPWPAGW